MLTGEMLIKATAKVLIKKVHGGTHPQEIAESLTELLKWTVGKLSKHEIAHSIDKKPEVTNQILLNFSDELEKEYEL